MKKDKLIICVDFDGTCTTHAFPYIGKDIGAIPVLKRLVAEGHLLVLFTMRSDYKGTTLSQAVKWFETNEIPLYGKNVNPSQYTWTKSPKAYGQLYIDDAALGCPLLFNEQLSERPFVDWEEVESILEIKGILTTTIKI